LKEHEPKKLLLVLPWRKSLLTIQMLYHLQSFQMEMDKLNLELHTVTTHLDLPLALLKQMEMVLPGHLLLRTSPTTYLKLSVKEFIQLLLEA
jgi:hypothetical protein